jgi:hypothetical protein
VADEEIPSRVIADISFVGRGGGAVKTLDGFKKGHHSVPDAANATTNGFLAKICERELAENAEKLFQDARAELGYKRKDISLSVASPAAVLVARDFTVEIGYALEESDPARYAVTTVLRGLGDPALARTEGFSRVFAGRFAEISFTLQKAAKVEAVIDVIEALEGEGGLGVTYPSDCRDCVIEVEGVDAQVRCTGVSLELVFPRAGAPAELIDGFAAVRGAFQISKALAGLVG